MEILTNEILPLFEKDSTAGEPKLNTLIQAGPDEYILYVTLEDVYNARIQTHLVPVLPKKIEYQIPVYYHQIVLSKKGRLVGDLLIKIKTMLHPDFIRVNSYDLLYYLSVDATEKEATTISLLDNEALTISLDPELANLRKIPEKGLPKPDQTRGNLYIWIERNQDKHVSQTKEILLELLNYDDHANIEF